jgi:hypothetical protein
MKTDILVITVLLSNFHFYSNEFHLILVFENN